MADRDVLVRRILTHIVPECYYERMLGQECKGIDEGENYNDFLAWNNSCVEALTLEDLKWVWGLCQRLNNNKIGMMDMEDCGIWKADAIYYDTDKNLVIVHPR